MEKSDLVPVNQLFESYRCWILTEQPFADVTAELKPILRARRSASGLCYNAELVLGYPAYLPLDVFRSHRRARKLQLKLEVANLLDARQRAVDGYGQVPIRLQPDLVDQLGQTATVSLRKLF